MTNIPEIEELKNLVEQRYGKVLGTSTDFDEFSLYLQRKQNHSVSSSTLKRIWGYVGDIHKHRIATLDQLSQYIGYASFHDFTVWLKTSTKYNSSFFNANQLVSSELKPGATVVIGWNPNRIVRLRHIGGSEYEVISSDNSKLCAGDRFVTGCFIKEQPLFLPYIERGETRTAPFVAGRNGGLTVMNVIDDKP